MKEIVIYPHNWVHNANVYGFLKALSWYGFDVSKLLKDDGTLTLSEDIQKDIYEKESGIPKLYKIWIESTDKLRIAKVNEKYDPYVNIPKRFFMNDERLYKNLIPERGDKLEKFWVELRRMIEHVFDTPKIEGNDTCFLCGNPVSVPNDKKLIRYHEFSPELFGKLSSWIRHFPNAFWNMEQNLYVCDVCSQMALFRHFVFYKNNDKFINAPSFKVIWYLNEALEAFKKLNTNEALGYSLLETSLKIYRILGAWARQNVEIITLTDSGYEISYLPPKVVDSLLTPKVVYLLKVIRDDEIFQKVLREDTNGILTDTYISLRMKITERQNLIRKAKREIQIQINPMYTLQLYLELRKIYSGVKIMVKPEDLKKLGKKVAEAFENTKYRLLELVRLGKRSEAYHLVLRTYMTRKMVFPKELNYVFSVRDDEVFKALMFAYISGMAGGEHHE